MVDDRRRILVLGAGDGWHSNQLKAAVAMDRRYELTFCQYESLFASVGRSARMSLGCNSYSPSALPLDSFDAVLARTMPAGSLEKITLRLSVLHALAAVSVPVINSPRGLELAIDKFSTLAYAERLGYDTPETLVVQSRAEAMTCFDHLGGDCVVKPIFGGEGRGVMRIRDRELAWTVFSSLDQMDAVFYIQAFVPPGGHDTRLLVIGDHVIAASRENKDDFRTNHAHGAKTRLVEPTREQTEMAKRLTTSMGLTIAAVDMIDSLDGSPKVLEVNAVPGWKGIQQVCETNIAAGIIQTISEQMNVAKNERKVSEP
ncbi:Ribosomal protein S6 modification protein [Novipirellula aureliae]|uniref:Ribosomal protein S6 modification protein n=2 Tax=Novipirellula aureliae TaxID=2527966 RepID=A0A5C6DD21_9BACT|nr:Ribosomal protein S6 modification protein [Novipirellula aureliae]